ncbi:hypothetical protein MXB_3086 [Myxobolus squamalis]|nr:hypothetical protein MXB_3086 [Myxobolus squamalis]
MAVYLNMIQNGLAGFEDQDRDTEGFSKFSKSVNDAIACYAIIYKEKKRVIRIIRLTQKPSERINCVGRGLSVLVNL